MKQEEKQLLIKDLCARLPYGVKIELMPITRDKCVTLTPVILQDYFKSADVNYLPYLRTMSNMTKEERKQLDAILVFNGNILTCMIGTSQAFDWLNARHFDYRGLIPKGLAIAVTEENNPYKE